MNLAPKLTSKSVYPTILNREAHPKDVKPFLCWIWLIKPHLTRSLAYAWIQSASSTMTSERSGSGAPDRCRKCTTPSRNSSLTTMLYLGVAIAIWLSVIHEHGRIRWARGLYPTWQGLQPVWSSVIPPTRFMRYASTGPSWASIPRSLSRAG
ncbi:hypothetical protein F5Y15DRAFT_398555 [Xylariaceae sp. FL0016]|nr:hypothetical protein F5Y15DRAFT_398555 [Xylariaceae sp. FL0016]